MLRIFGRLLAVATILISAPLAAQTSQNVTTIDPNVAIDGDLSGQTTPPPSSQTTPPPSTTTGTRDYGAPYDPALGPPPQTTTTTTTPSGPPPATTGTPGPTGAPAPSPASSTYNREDLIGAAEGVFGKGAKGLAELIEKILKDQGEPNAYISGREASGAFVVGLRYGSGIMQHKIEGRIPVYWTGPSVGFDVGGDANKVFVLVYNLYDSHDLYKRFPAGEGRAYFVGGLSASYLRRGNIVLIPVRLGVGWRLGANVGYMKFSDHQKWLPF